MRVWCALSVWLVWCVACAWKPLVLYICGCHGRWVPLQAERGPYHFPDGATVSCPRPSPLWVSRQKHILLEVWRRGFGLPCPFLLPWPESVVALCIHILIVKLVQRGLGALSPINRVWKRTSTSDVGTEPAVRSCSLHSQVIMPKPYVELTPAQRKIVTPLNTWVKKFVKPVDTCPTVFWLCNAMAVVAFSDVCVCVCRCVRVAMYSLPIDVLYRGIFVPSQNLR